MDAFQVCQLIVSDIHAHWEKQSGVSPVNDFVCTKLQNENHCISSKSEKDEMVNAALSHNIFLDKMYRKTIYGNRLHDNRHQKRLPQNQKWQWRIGFTSCKTSNQKTVKQWFKLWITPISQFLCIKFPHLSTHGYAQINDQIIQKKEGKKKQVFKDVPFLTSTKLVNLGSLLTTSRWT